MRIAVGADHRGLDMLTQLIADLQEQQHHVVKYGARDSRMCDYPDVAYPVAVAVAGDQAERGILVCGSGIGMCIAANTVKGVRAALVHDELGAEISRRHNDANLLCLPADLLGLRVVERIVSVWLKTEFEGGRHARRVRKIAAIEAGEHPSSIGNRTAAP